jgi:hypothetical protein
MNIMNREHPGWQLYGQYLWRAVYPDGQKSRCKCDYTHTVKIFETYFPEVDINASIEFYKANQGYCDCEIGFNIFGVK